MIDEPQKKEQKHSQLTEDLNQSLGGLLEIHQLLSEQLLMELRSGGNKISLYNAGTVYIGLVNGLARLQSLVKEAAIVVVDASVSEKETADQKTLRKVGARMLALISKVPRADEQHEAQTNIIA